MRVYMSRRIIAFMVALCTVSTGLSAQQAKDFKPALDSMRVLLLERTSVDGTVKASKVVKNKLLVARIKVKVVKVKAKVSKDKKTKITMKNQQVIAQYHKM